MGNRIVRKLLTVLAAAFTATLLGYCPAMAAVAPPGPLVNTANVSYGDSGGNPMPLVSASVDVTILQKQGASVLIAPATLSGSAGASVVYTVTVTNTGNAADSFTLSSDHDAGASTFNPGAVQFFSDPGASSLITAPIGPIAAGGSMLVYMKLPIPGSAAANTRSNDDARATSTSNTSVLGVSPESQTTVGGSVLTITKSVSNNNPTPGDAVTYTITVRNAGTSDVTNVTVTDNIGSVLGISTFVSGSIKLNTVAQNDSLLSGNVITAPVGTLGPNATATLVFSVNINRPSNHAQAVSLSGAGASNVAEAAADGASPVDSAPVSITVLSPAISTTKAVSPASAKPGDTVTYTITARNAGNDAAGNVVIKDDLNALPVTYKAGTLKLNGLTQPNPAGSLIQVNINSIAAGATAAVTFDATVN